MADTRASCGSLFPGATDGFIARSRKEVPGWYQSRNDLSKANGPLTESSRVEGCSRTHLGRCLGLKSRQGGGALTQFPRPAPPSPADRNKGSRHASLDSRGSDIFLYTSCLAGEPAGQRIPDPREKLQTSAKKEFSSKNAANDSRKCKFGAAPLMAIWQYVWKV